MARTTLRASLLALAALLLGTGAVAPQGAVPQAARITALLPLAGHNGTQAFGVNERGVVAGVSFSDANPDAPGSSLPVTWTSGRVSLLSMPPGAVQGAAFAIDDVGRAVGTIVLANLERRPVLWVRGRAQYLPVPAGTVAGDAGAINNQGASAGELIGEELVGRAVTWNGTRLELLLPFGGVPESRANDINLRQQVVGYVLFATGPQAAIWVNRRPALLPKLPGFEDGQAIGINDQGVAVGVQEEPGGFDIRAVVWRNGRVSSLPRPEGVLFSQASAINNSGAVVGTIATFPGDPDEGVLWVGGRMVRLLDLLPEVSAWQRLIPRAINAGGAIAGTGDIDGRQLGFLLRLVR